MVGAVNRDIDGQSLLTKLCNSVSGTRQENNERRSWKVTTSDRLMALTLALFEVGRGQVQVKFGDAAADIGHIRVRAA